MSGKEPKSYLRKFAGDGKKKKPICLISRNFDEEFIYTFV